MSGFIFVPIVRVRNVGFLDTVQNVVCTNCRGAECSLFDEIELYQDPPPMYCAEFFNQTPCN